MYVLVIISGLAGEPAPLLDSETVTVGVPQLSLTIASDVFATGTSLAHWKLASAGAVTVGGGLETVVVAVAELLLVSGSKTRVLMLAVLLTDELLARLQSTFTTSVNMAVVFAARVAAVHDTVPG